MSVEKADERILRLALDDSPPPPPDAPSEDEGDDDGSYVNVCNHITIAVPAPTGLLWAKLAVGAAVAIGVGLTLHDLLAMGWASVIASFTVRGLAVHLVILVVAMALAAVAGWSIEMAASDEDKRWRMRWAVLAAALTYVTGFITFSAGALR